MKRSFFKKALLFVLAMTLCFSSFALVASAETAPDSYEDRVAAYRAKIMANDVTADDFLIGSWVSFYSFDIDSYEYQLDQMAAAGINFNIFAKDFGSTDMHDAAYWRVIEAEYAKRNMVYLMNGGMDASLVLTGAKYANKKEHCIGYHVKDEPFGHELKSVVKQMLAYRDADKERYPFVNLFPSYAGEGWLGGTYREYVERYIELLGAENVGYLSHDYYPFASNGSVRTGIFADMEVIRSVAYENGKLKTHAFPQSTGWNSSRMPNADEMRWNVYAYLAYGFKALSWFNLVCPGGSDTEGEGFYNSIIYRDGTIRDRELYDAWSELNWEIRGLSDILMSVDVSHAYHVVNDLSGVEYLPEDFYLQPNDARRNNFVISVMESKNGNDQYIMIYNKGLESEGAECLFDITDANALCKVEYFDPNTGEYTELDISDGTLADSFEAGEGRVYRLNYVAPENEEDSDVESEDEPNTDGGATDTPDDSTPTTPDTSSKKGCSSVIGTLPASVTVIAIAGAAVVFRRRRSR